MVTSRSTPKDGDRNLEQPTAVETNGATRRLIDRSNWAIYAIGAAAFATLLAIALILIGTNENTVQIAWVGLWLLAGAMLTWLITMGIIVFLVARDIFRYFRWRIAQHRNISRHDRNQVDSA